MRMPLMPGTSEFHLGQQGLALPVAKRADP